MRTRRFVRAAGVCLLWPMAPLAGAANVASTWQGGNGSWTDPTRWSSNPLFPNNGNGGQLYDVVVPVNDTTSITYNQDLTIENLDLGTGVQSSAPGLTLNVNHLFTLRMNVLQTHHIVTQDWDIASAVPPRVGYYLNNGTIDVRGNARWMAAELGARDQTINILPGASFDILSDLRFDREAPATPETSVINNAGLLSKSAGAGVSWIRPDLINTGAIEVRTGTLQIEKGNSTGSIRILANAHLDFKNAYTIAGVFDTDHLDVTGGLVTFSPGASFPKTMSVLFRDGRLFFNTGQPRDFASLTMSGISTLNRGFFGGSDVLSVSGNAHISGGRLQGGGGSLLLAGPAVIDTASLDLENYTLQIGNVTNLRTQIGNLGPGLVDILPSGTLLIENNNRITAAVSNAGIIRKISGVGGSDITSLTNTGTVEIQTGSLRLISSGGSLAGTFSGAPGTSLDINGGYSLKPGVTFGSLPISVTGRANIETGASVQWTTLALSGTVDVKAGASLTLPAPLVMQSGTLGGLGTINAVVTNSGGTVDPGVIGSIAANPILTLNGNYTQSPAGRLRIDVNFPTVPIIADILDVHGTADLAGSITLFELAFRQLRAGDHFDILWADQIIDHGYSASFPMGLRSGVTFVTSIEQRGDRQALRVDMVAVPEPAALILLGMCVIPASRRRRLG